MKHDFRPYEYHKHNPNEYYVCKGACKNITHSTLPRTSEPMTERQTCTCCGTVIEFSTTAAPKKISNPVSRRKWGSRTPVKSVILKYTTANWQNPDTRLHNRIKASLWKIANKFAK